MNKTNNKPFVIGVAGGSGSGKSTVTREVLASIGPEMVAVVMQDDYYLDQTHLSAEERRNTNYDHPKAFDWPLTLASTDWVLNHNLVTKQRQKLFAARRQKLDPKYRPSNA